MNINATGVVKMNNKREIKVNNRRVLNVNNTRVMNMYDLAGKSWLYSKWQVFSLYMEKDNLSICEARRKMAYHDNHK